MNYVLRVLSLKNGNEKASWDWRPVRFSILSFLFAWFFLVILASFALDEHFLGVEVHGKIN